MIVMMIMTIMSDDNEYNVADNDDGDNHDQYVGDGDVYDDDDYDDDYDE